MNDDDKLATILRANTTLDLTARLLLARGVNRNARDARVDTADWSPVTNQADQRGWATALVLLEGGVPRDYGTPVGSVLRSVIQKGEWQTTDSERADPAYQAVIAAAK